MPERRTQIPNLELTTFCTWTEKSRFANPESITPITEWSGSSLAQGEWVPSQAVHDICYVKVLKDLTTGERRSASPWSHDHY